MGWVCGWRSAGLHSAKNDKRAALNLIQFDGTGFSLEFDQQTASLSEKNETLQTCAALAWERFDHTLVCLLKFLFLLLDILNAACS